MEKRKISEVKYGKSNDNTVKARRDYVRHDGGLDIDDVPQDIPAEVLEDMMFDYYRAHVLVLSPDICVSGFVFSKNIITHAMTCKYTRKHNEYVRLKNELRNIKIIVNSYTNVDFLLQGINSA